MGRSTFSPVNQTTTATAIAKGGRGPTTTECSEEGLRADSAAHLLVVVLREHALKGTTLECAQANTLRLRLFEIGALVTVSVRRVYVRLSSAFRLQLLLLEAIHRMRGSPVGSR